jgi:adenylate cyclase
MKRGLALLAAGVLAAFAIEAALLHWMMPLENRLLDAFVKRHAAGLAPDPEIVLVDIDERSLAAMENEAGRWPWPRVVYAELIEGLAAQKPRAIVFDMMFIEKDRFRPQDDAALAEAAARHANTYFAFLRLPDSADSRGIRIADYAGDFGLTRSASVDPDARIALVPPLVLPKDTHGRAGLITFKEDADGVGRRYLLRETVGGWRIPSLPARVASALGFAVPEQDSLVLAWRGAAKSFPRVSFSDLYEEFGRSAKKRPANEFAGRIVVVGAAATGLQDLRVTPMDSLHPGAEILGTAIENLKNGRHMRYLPEWSAAALGVALILLLSLAFRRGFEVRAIGAALAGATALIVAAQWLLVGRLLLWPVLTPLAAAWTFYAAAALGEYLRARRERQAAITQFSRFTNPHVARELVERGGIETGRRDVTLLFSDIRGFTTLSETRKPEEVIALLNRYFSLQVDVVFNHGGSLDKFIGDCIMAMWGAPLDDPHHARHAVACALDMADTLQAFKRELGAEQSGFDVGIGLHSGPAVVGLMGSQTRRLEYTAIGDTVNLASRIEGLTKEAGRRILVSRDTMEQCADSFDFLPAGSYKVKGRAQEVELFEPRRKS